MLECTMNKESGYVKMHGTASELIFDTFRIIDQVYRDIKTDDEKAAAWYLKTLRHCLSEDQYAFFAKLAAPDIETDLTSKEEVRE